MFLPKVNSSFIRWVSLVIGILSTLFSIYYLIKFFDYNGMPSWLSTTLATTYVIFVNIIIFDSSIKQFLKAGEILEDWQRPINQMKKKGFFIFKIIKSYFIGSVVFLVWLILILYPIIATVSGQYEQLVNAENKRNNKTIMTNNQEIKTNIDDDINNLKEEKANLTNELKSLQITQNSITTMEDQANYKTTFDKNQKRIVAIGDRIAYINTTISTNNQAKNDLLKVDKTLNKDSFKINLGSVYNYFAKLSNLDPLMIQFLLSIFPSLFTDIVSSISFMIFFYKK